MTCTARVSSPFFLKGAEQQFGRVQRCALVRNGTRGRSLVFRSLIHIDPETDRSALWRLAAPGNPQQRQRQKRERGRMFMTAGRHYGINGCGCKSFVGNVDAAVAAGRTTLNSGEKRTKRGEGCVPEEESGSRRKGLFRGVHALNFREEGLFAFANSV